MLQVHFGTDHPIVKSYTEAWGVCAKAKVEIARSTKVAKERLRDQSEPTVGDVNQAAGDEIKASAQAAVDALKVRDAWTKEALRAVRKT